MFQCTKQPFGSRQAKRVIKQALDFIAQWRSESRASKAYMRVKFLDRRQRVYIDDFHYHIDHKNPADKVGRYRLLPCVKELLTHSKDSPTKTADGNFMVEGTTPDGERFRVIIRPEKRGGSLQSFYPG